MHFRPPSKFSFWLKAFLAAFLVWLGIFLLFRYVLSNDIVEGQSMEPNFQQNERLLALKVKPVRRNAVIILKAPDHSGQYYIKRVIGLPGERVAMKSDQLFINGQPTAEPYLQTYRNAWQRKQTLPFTANFTLASLKSTHAKRVPKNAYFVMGDNRTVSNDSRSFGFVPAKNVVSVVVMRYWPIYTWQFY